LQRWAVLTTSSEETGALGRSLGEIVKRPSVILLEGELGAGKTCLIQGLARGLGVPEGQPVTSPSYALMNHYRGRLDLYHFDLYRLFNTDDVLDLGFDEYLAGTGVTVVEWADRVPGLTPEGLWIHLSYRDNDFREVAFRARGGEAEDLLEILVRHWQQGRENR
jgi:tRNA threonylcarbamoyladenosine biosynthesis protein TsaE